MENTSEKHDDSSREEILAEVLLMALKNANADAVVQRVADSELILIDGRFDLATVARFLITALHKNQ